MMMQYNLSWEENFKMIDSQEQYTKEARFSISKQEQIQIKELLQSPFKYAEETPYFDSDYWGDTEGRVSHVGVLFFDSDTNSLENCEASPRQEMASVESFTPFSFKLTYNKLKEARDNLQWQEEMKQIGIEQL
jgi:hypothetical protein